MKAVTPRQGHEQHVGKRVALDIVWLKTCVCQIKDSVSR
jgi:hypothetical protein